MMMELSKTSRRRLAALVASIVLALGLCHLVVEGFGLRFAQPTEDVTLQTLATVVREERRVEVAFVGSSRMRRAITVPVVEATLQETLGRPVTAFNFGLQGGVASSFAVVVRDVLRDERLPKVIVLGLGARSLNGNSPRQARAIRHLYAPGDLLGSLGPRRVEEFAASLYLLFRAPTTLLQLWRAPAAEVSTLVAGGGSFYCPVEGPVPLDIHEAEKIYGAKWVAEAVEKTESKGREGAQARRNLLADFEIGRAGVALELIVDLCQERGVTLVVVNLPVTPTFRALAYQHGEYDAYLSRVRALSEVEGFAFVDLAEPPWLPHECFFADGVYLNQVGAHGLSARIAREVVAPLLAE